MWSVTRHYQLDRQLHGHHTIHPLVVVEADDVELGAKGFQSCA
ncbi:MAG: hypothetical protein ACKVP3_15550 [Hyphomicrobiaceae bacterium]